MDHSVPAELHVSRATPAKCGDQGASARLETAWECRYCHMVVSSDAPAFTPGPHYAGPCARNPDAYNRVHDWLPASDAHLS